MENIKNDQGSRKYNLKGKMEIILFISSEEEKIESER